MTDGATAGKLLSCDKSDWVINAHLFHQIPQLLQTQCADHSSEEVETVINDNSERGEMDDEVMENDLSDSNGSGSDSESGSGEQQPGTISRPRGESPSSRKVGICRNVFLNSVWEIKRAIMAWCSGQHV